MSTTIYLYLFTICLLILGGIILSKVTSRYGVPTLLTFLCIGLLFGNGGEYDFHYDHPEITLYISQMALVIIIFTGGINTDFKSIRPIIFQGLLLSTIGVVITAVVVGLFVHWVLGYPLLIALLLGIVISSTDAAAVFSILNSRKIRLNPKIRPLIEFESGTNDPITYFLTVTFTLMIVQGESHTGLYFVSKLLQNMLIGTIAGLAGGLLMVWLLKILKLKIGLRPILVITKCILVYSTTELIGGNGFLAVYITGMILGNLKLNNSYIANFFEGIAWMMEILLFLALGLQVFLQELPAFWFHGVLVALVLMFLARPLSVLICLLPTKVPLRDSLYISWVGLRGATPLIFALYPVTMGLPEGKIILNTAFFVVLCSIIIQGFSVEWVANKLKLVNNDVKPKKKKTVENKFGNQSIEIVKT